MNAGSAGMRSPSRSTTSTPSSALGGGASSGTSARTSPAAAATAPIRQTQKMHARIISGLFLQQLLHRPLDRHVDGAALAIDPAPLVEPPPLLLAPRREPRVGVEQRLVDD